MTTEQREAIEKLEYVNRWYDCNNYYSRYELDCIETVLSLIKEQQKEIDKYKTLYERALADLVKADKQIDLMAGEIEYAGCIKKVWECDEKDCKDCIKQYFETKVKKGE